MFKKRTLFYFCISLFLSSAHAQNANGEFFIGGSVAFPFENATVHWENLYAAKDLSSEHLTGSGIQASFDFGCVTGNNVYFDSSYGLGGARFSSCTAFTMSALMSLGLDITPQKNIEVIPSVVGGMFAHFFDKEKLVYQKERNTFQSEISLFIGPELIIRKHVSYDTGIVFRLPFLFGIGYSRFNFYNPYTKQQDHVPGYNTAFLFIPQIGFYHAFR